MEVSTPNESVSKTVPLEDLPRDELITKYRSLLTIAQKAKQAKDTLMSENVILKDKLNHVSNDGIIGGTDRNDGKLDVHNHYADRKLAEYELRLRDADKNVFKLDTANQGYTRQIKRLSDENEELISHLKKQESQLQELQMLGSQQKEQLLEVEKNYELKLQCMEKETSNKITELQKMLSVSLSEIKNLQSGNSELYTSLKQAESLLLDVDKNKTITEIELQEKNDKIKSLEQSVKDLKNYVMTCNNCNILIDENSELQSYVKQLQLNLGEYENEVVTNNEKIKEKDLEMERNVNIIDDLNTELYKNKALVEKLNCDLSTINKKLGDNQIFSSGVASDLENSNEKLRNKLKAYHTKIVKLASAMKHLKESKNELLLIFKTYMNQVCNWKGQLDLLLTTIYEKEQTYSVTLIEVTNYKNDIECLKEKTFDLNNIINDLNENIVQYKTENEIYRNEVTSLKLSNDALNAELATLMKDITEGKEMHNNLEQSNQQLRKEISKIKEEYETLNQRSENLSEEKSYLLKDNLLLKDEVENYITILEDDKKKSTNVENMQIKLEESEFKLTELDNNYKILTEQLRLSKEREDILQNNIQKLQNKSRVDSETIENHLGDIARLNNLNQELYETIDKSKVSESKFAELSSEEISRLVKVNKESACIIKKLEEEVYRRINTVDAFTETDDDEVIQNDLKEKFINLKRENVELLSEMNEMNQALKERGETISKQQAYCDDIYKKLQEADVQAKQNLDIVNMKEDLIRQLEEEIIYLKSTSKIASHETSLQNQLQMKSDEIESLKAELLSLKERMTDTTEHLDYEESENMSTSTIGKSEEILRMKDLESSWEERYGKLRNLAIKLKTKVKELTADILKEQHEKVEIQQKLMKTTQTFQNQIDKLEDDLETCKSENTLNVKKIDGLAIDISKDKKKLADNEELISHLHSEIDNMNKVKQNSENWKKQVSIKVQHLKKELEANAAIKKNFENTISKLKTELEAKTKQLQMEIENHNATKNTLQGSITESKKHAVLNLEMQDYEKSVADLSEKLETKKGVITKLRNQIDSQEIDMNILKEQNISLIADSKVLENDMYILKQEIESLKLNINELENTVNEKDRLVYDLTYKMETTKLENEDLSTQLSKVIAEHQKNTNHLKTELEHIKSHNSTTDQTNKQLQAALHLKQSELNDMFSEYQGYKVRAQSVLRQNQNRDITTEEKLLEEVESLRAQTHVLNEELNGLRYVIY